MRIHSLDDAIAFLRRFHRRLNPRPELDPATIPADLPDALAQVYRVLGGWIAIPRSAANRLNVPFASQDSLYSLDTLKPTLLACPDPFGYAEGPGGLNSCLPNTPGWPILWPCGQISKRMSWP